MSVVLCSFTCTIFTIKIMTTFGAAVIIIHKLLENKTRGLGGGNNKADLVLAARTIDKWGRNIKETTESERGNIASSPLLTDGYPTLAYLPCPILFIQVSNHSSSQLFKDDKLE